MFAYLTYQIRHALVVPFVFSNPKPWYNEGISFVKYILTKTALIQLVGTLE
jgi:hypothetical protein